MKNAQNLDSKGFQEIYNSGIKLEIAMILLWGVLCGGFLSSNKQATPGKRIMKIKVVDADGDRIGFKAAFGRIVALPLILLTIQTPERYAVHEKIDEMVSNNVEFESQQEMADYLQTPLTTATNILSLLILATWFINISRDGKRRAFHDILFNTRVIYEQK